MLGLPATELLDPVRGQYKEFFIVVNAMLGAEHVTSCPYIWVDRDFALIRGWIQGFPKKLGRGAHDAQLRARLQGRGPQLRRHAGGHGRLLAEGSVTPEQVSESGPTHNDPPLINRPPLSPFGRRPVAGRRPPRAGAGAKQRPVDLGHPRGVGDARLHDAPGEEHAELAPVRVGKGFRFQFAYTVDDLETVRELA